jgi:hypothetical protein
MKATIPAINHARSRRKTAAIPAIKTVAAKAAAMDSAAAKTSAKTVGLGSSSADQRSKGDHNDGHSLRHLRVMRPSFSHRHPSSSSDRRYVCSHRPDLPRQKEMTGLLLEYAAAASGLESD